MPRPAGRRARGPQVETLRAAISINQRFSFINELFNGETWSTTPPFSTSMPSLPPSRPVPT